MAAVDASPGAARAPRRRAGSGRPDSLSRQLQDARNLGEVPRDLADRHSAARRAFEEISGFVQAGEKSADDIQRLRILDALILELSALEREIYMAVGDGPPEEIRSAYAQLLQRLNGPSDRVPDPEPRTPTLMDRLRAGTALQLRLDIGHLSPAGLVAMGQLLHFEPEVQVVAEEAADADPPPPLALLLVEPRTAETWAEAQPPA